jgi:hypothetical protein
VVNHASAIRYRSAYAGWAILVTPTNGDAFPTKDAAYRVAIDYARKLQCAGHSVRVRVLHHGDDVPAGPMYLPLAAVR